ncbi:MAG: dTDP-glucose 4,6-dehydratase [Armatimonadetes bacterium]|nr:dTDP-glucose 4,6-dehydratase [Armatimonadota bacterium]MDE2207566.1 dTDP-glucose 4,6-dehydratase [Armatimonadota bacterium]
MSNLDPKRILVTGGAGFVGSAYIRMALARRQDLHVVNLDKLTYAANPDNVEPWAASGRYQLVCGDVCVEEDVRSAFDAMRQLAHGPVEAVVHFAAESHVDRSIEDPARFLRTNVLGTEVMLRESRAASVERFIQVSTDEVYGSLRPDDPPFTEATPLAPNSPYAASKAAADLLAMAYHSTWQFPAIVTRCSNNYGPYQFPEKLIPLMACNALEDRSLPVYGDGLNIRDWIHVEDHARGIDAALRRGTPGRSYNLGGNHEATNLSIVRALLGALDKPERLIHFVEDRPGHDRRYAMDSSRAMSELAWSPVVEFDRGLTQTALWYRDHLDWVRKARTGEYVEYYKRMYANRGAAESAHGD